ncbi:CDP-alcohol phosphatidyltransferase family protein [Roseomonas sp. OT10]|uniref:CDP-alcohol phosphatidyltransferase family protein n=1 Tax=Roseomonas cutis TaxID=2897332 RepID=UPI001E6417AF|nr:CDP-alcohol phosphatidyltransferase family protein [Roseomonas sp. OT10]UFN47528.1 CDP-alcohol phosphatidyltransferase family protein [Roseomonas sp. OT10]
MPGAPDPADPDTGPAGTGQPPPPPAAGAADSGLLTIPNAITFLRLCAVPAVVWCILQHRLDLAFLLFVAAGISDAVDGWWARTFQVRSTLGALLDPVADKALLVSVYVTLAVIDVLPDWLAILVVFRDVLIVGGVLLLSLAGAPPRIRPLPISKANTLLQIVLAAAALGIAGFGLRLPGVLDVLTALTALTTVLSGAAYVWALARRARAG